MVRSARRGRQGRNTNQQQLVHQHVTDTNPPSTKSQSNSAGTTPATKKKSSKKAPKDSTKELDQDQIYDYEAHTHSKAANRLTANQIDDHRLTGSKPKSRSDQQDDGDFDEISQINDLVHRCQNEDEDGFGLVNSDDDESIDSDEAMGELDDDQLKSQKKPQIPLKKRKPAGRVRFQGANSPKVSHDDSDDEADLDGDEFIDASTMLDIGAESDNAFSDEEDGTDNSDGSSSSDGGVMNDIDLNEDDAEDESKLNDLAKMVDNLTQMTNQKRKDIDPDQATDSQTKKRKLLPVQTESRNEGELLATSGRVNLEDLLSNLSSAPGLSELKKSIKPLIASNKSSSKGPLPAPLETRHQQQVERQIAYELTKKEMTKWDETTKLAKGLSGKSSDGKNRFVVPANNLSMADKEPDGARWNMHFKPLNDLENQVVGLLESSQLTSKKLIEEEDDQLVSQGNGVQKLKEKVIESKLARELMFRAERKAKRVAKIKSKAFRRIRKKEKQRKSISSAGAEPDLQFMNELDEIDGGDRVQTRKEEMEIERARERVSLKHSSQGKWAKKVGELKGLGSDRNAAIQERIRREELLKKKIDGHGSGDSEDAEEEDSDFDSDATIDVDGIKAHALDQLAQIDSKTSNSANDPPLKGLFAMKFMQNAMAVKERKAEEAREQLRQQLQETEGGSTEEEDGNCGIKVQGNSGRMMFNPDVCHEVTEPETTSEQLSNPSFQKTTKTSGSHLRVMALNPNPSTKDVLSTGHAESKPISEDVVDPDVGESNPWLAPNSSSLGNGTISRIKDLNPNSKNHFDNSTIQAEKAKLKAAKSHKKQSVEKQLAAEDAKVNIDLDVLTNEEVGARALKQMENDDPEGNHQEAVIRKGHVDGQGRTAFEQRELVKLAFADDQVVAQFEEEKRQQVENDAPKDVDLTLPGWGDWVGKGGKKAKSSRKIIHKVAGTEPNGRKDAKLSNVIILESTSVKMNNAKKLGKYQLKDIPFPYVNKDQVELGMAQSIGPEFNTRLNHRHLVRPDVLTRPGVFIHPVEKPV